MIKSALRGKPEIGVGQLDFRILTRSGHGQSLRFAVFWVA
jgi:hypothetical protein